MSSYNKQSLVSITTNKRIKFTIHVSILLHYRRHTGQKWERDRVIVNKASYLAIINSTFQKGVEHKALPLELK